MSTQIRIDNYSFNTEFIKSCKKLEQFEKQHPKYSKELLEEVYYMVHERKVKKDLEEQHTTLE